MVKKVVSYILLGAAVVVLASSVILAVDLIKYTRQNLPSTDESVLMPLLWYKAMFILAAVPGLIVSIICSKITENKPVKIISGVLIGIFIVVLIAAGIAMSR